MVVKSKVVSKHMEDLTNIFGILRKHKLHLNASKCSFGVGSGRFLGYMVTHRGIEVNPDHIKAINDLQAPQNPKEVQKLTGMTAALNRFISRSAERCRPLFRLLHKWQGFEWTKECAVAFQQLKEYLSRPPIMSSPEVDEVLFAYLAVAPHAVSFVLIREDSGIQRSVYYLSKSLHEAELPFKSILRSADYTRRIAKWGTILGAFDIKYMPRTSMEGQVLADLVAEFAECPEEVNMKQDNMDEKSVGLISTQGGSSWRKMGGKIAELFSDSRLVVSQVKGELEARDPRMQGYLSQVRRMQTKFESFDLAHIPRGENTHVDSLATLATSSVRNFPRLIIVEDLHTPTSPENGVCQVYQANLAPSWMDPILKFLESDILPEEKVQVEKIRRKAP
ncbi:uncharacterized protein LOC126721919 [Quercus robur]|uniref:uncharacterized protein LOC126721919 n=1 Tax=Quercus robur TaxID=38942 RepID=UPI002161B39E|nr:uncharacterized protein LOC126721919 [Quercus robur]